MNNTSRREFIGMAGAGLVLARTGIAKAVPSERVHHAVIGGGGQGCAHVSNYDKFPDCDVVAVCDVDPKRREKMKQLAPNARVESNFRRILEDPTIDSVSIATPDHWHTPMALHALQAGKHVYVEKPCAHNVHECQILLKAAEHYGKCVQHGTQSRSSQGIIDAIAYLQSGALGKVRLAKAINHQMRGPIGRAPVTDPPPGVDYDMWSGPAPLHPFTTNRWHYNWHWFWDYGGGDMVNDGIHQVDIARWGLDVGLPNAVQGAGAQLYYDDDHETPDTQNITFVYDDCQLIYEMRLWTRYKLEGHDNGVVFYCDNGRLEIGREGCFAKIIGEKTQKVGGGQDLAANFHNFIEGVKANDPDHLLAPVREGAISSALCHYGNIVTRVGRGQTLVPGAWNFQNDDEANALLKRTYRKGYELPEI